jgi:hypothetical protein
MVLSFGALYGVAWLLARPAFAERPYLFDWLHTLTTSAIVDLTGPMLPQAVGVYVASGLLAAVVYAELFEPRLSVPIWQRGLAFSLLPNLVSLIIVLPLLGAGPLGLGLGAGPLPLLGSTALYAGYGLILAGMFGPLGDIGQGETGRRVRDNVWAQPAMETAAANGVVTGLVLGSVLSLSTGLALRGGAPVPILDPIVLTVGGALCGGALGAFVGSFVGLSAEGPD